MEFGPRALGNRSILADARGQNMQQKLNLRIKFRESFRPFVAAVLREDVAKYFELNWVVVQFEFFGTYTATTSVGLDDCASCAAI